MRSLFAALAVCFALAPAWAQDLPVADLPALISADQVSYDESLEVVTASGNVEISQGGRVLLADSISYNLRNDVVIASGNITLLEPTGEVIFAQYVELTDDLREGFVRDIRVMMTDRSRMAAASATRSGGNRSTLRKAVFSPCELCREDPSRAPLWQIKASRIVHNQEEKTIAYKDASFEVFGVPVAYLPYFEHPDPTVKRKSGFLAPTIGSSDSLGATVQVPYFWAISPDRDLTFEPIITSKQGPVLAADYRQLLRDGNLDLAGSATIADRARGDGTTAKDQFRGHLDAEGDFDINDTWRWGFDINRTTDDTYLRRYNFSSDRTLTSAAFVEGFRGRNYMAVNNFYYQGLRTEDIDEEMPIILPMLDYNFVSEPGIAGGKYTLDVNALALHREEGRESRRMSVIGGWELPYTSPIGDVYKLSLSLEADGYWVESFDSRRQDVIDPQQNADEHLTGRLFPQMALQWRYPWINETALGQQIIEPVVQAVAAPSQGMNPGEIPNEDSQDFEFDDTNLLSLNRFSGIDRVDPGSRVDYGIKWELIGDLGRTSAFVGQSYRVERDENFQPGSGLEDNMSDYVGRVLLQPTQYLDLLYRFRIGKDNLEAIRNELDVAVGPPALNLQLGYLDINNTSGIAGFPGRSELTMQLNSKLSEYWSAFVAHRRDLEADSSLSTEGGITYHDECILIQAVARRSFYSDREIEPEDSFFLRLVLKHLGEIGTS